MDTIIYLICCLGVSYAWSDTDASTPFRNMVARIPYIRKPLLCHECASFWISLFVSLFFNPLNDHGFIISNIILAFCGFFVNMAFVRLKLIPYR